MNMLKNAFLALCLVSGFHFAAHAQVTPAMQTAFSESYGLEYQQKYEEAIAKISSVYTESSYECNLRLAWLYYAAKKHSESVLHYQKAIKLMPAAVEPLWGVINPLAAQEKWSEVEKQYLAILKLDSKSTLANYRLGLMYYYRKDYTTAKKYFDVSLNLYPFDYDALLMSGWTAYFLGDTNNARILFNKVLLNRPQDASALEGLGLLK